MPSLSCEKKKKKRKEKEKTLVWTVCKLHSGAGKKRKWQTKANQAMLNQLSPTSVEFFSMN